MVGLFLLLACLGQPAFGQSGLPRPVVPMTEEHLGRKPRDFYGSLEGTIQSMRAYRPLDLSAESWKKANPGRSHEEWARQARELLRRGLHYDLPPVDLTRLRRFGRFKNASLCKSSQAFQKSALQRLSLRAPARS